jgi:transcription antitermination factor NusG
MFTKKSWYIIYTRPDCEKRVTALLLKNNTEAYCPVIAKAKQWADGKKMIETPLFRSYVFVCVSADTLAIIRRLPGVVSIVHWLNKPAVVPEDEIMAIKNSLTNYKRIAVEKIPVNTAETVRVVNGPLMNREGNIVQVRHRAVKIALPSLGYALTADFEKPGIQVINEEIKQSLVS